MFILDITYTAPTERMDELLPDHVAWLEKGRDAGRFVAWGRKVPRTGGMVFAVGVRVEIEAEAQRDPFVANGAASVTVIEFDAKFAAEGLEALRR
ncbi:YciI family protein [Croceicoccus marinus]|uniref:YCII-related domain-containing protein n=1 Tax=Croceicoccus marinus TaxID=450378 RepID=A0A1Z1FC06_9SPHN|nr:YciI family protein [Croceicoccus marinus]ARU16341.1 hypothetical protein A9D14_09225 [Croceicoccus marinus]